jgi:hypothetical protein
VGEGIRLATTLIKVWHPGDVPGLIFVPGRRMLPDRTLEMPWESRLALHFGASRVRFAARKAGRNHGKA